MLLPVSLGALIQVSFGCIIAGTIKCNTTDIAGGIIAGIIRGLITGTVLV